jgi:DNA-directed RNA polymerase specialized sigma24 family protein
MICDGIENCIQYIDNFYHNKSSNPFAYFTQIVFYAFLRRIAKEKRQLDIRQKIVDKLDYSQLFYGDADDVASMSDMNSIKEQINSSYYNR